MTVPSAPATPYSRLGPPPLMSAAQLADALTALGWSREQAARRLEVSVRSIYRYLADETDLPDRCARILRRALRRSR